MCTPDEISADAAECQQGVQVDVGQPDPCRRHCEASQGVPRVEGHPGLRAEDQPLLGPRRAGVQPFRDLTNPVGAQLDDQRLAEWDDPP
jgi:hypothetical protein